MLGHWGTTPGLNFIYVHLNRIIKEHELDMIYVVGPGHGGPGIVANAYLEGTYTRGLSEHHAGRGGNAETVQAVFLPRRDPQPRRAETPGSIHEGGELGYSLLARVRGRVR